MQTDYFRRCDKAKKTVFISECEKCQDTECPKNEQIQPWVARSYEEYMMGVDLSETDNITTEIMMKDENIIGERHYK